MNYGGGDNDCSYADLLRPHSMLVFTPRRNENGVDGAAAVGQKVSLYEAEVGKLPDIASSDMRQMIPGPSLRVSSTIWNANSFFSLRGFRPLVLRLV